MRLLRFLAPALFITVLAAFTVKSPRAEERHFSISLEHKNAGSWEATCDEGCAWKGVQMICDGACTVRIDESGIGPASARGPATAFAFEVADAATGLKAKGLNGMRWTELSYSCGTYPCRVRIDETGVTGL